MIIVGHRGGAAGRFSENSFEALQQALSDGLPAVEVDLRITKDKRLVVHHDAAIKLPNQNYKIKHLSLREVKAILPGIMSIEEAADMVLKNSQAELILDCKGRGWARTMAGLLKQRQRDGYDVSRVIILSFYAHELAILKRLFRPVRTYFLFRYLLFLHLMVSKLIGAEGAGYNWRFSARPLVWFCHLHGLKIYYYTVNDVMQARNYARHGVDYLATDYPKKIFKRISR